LEVVWAFVTLVYLGGMGGAAANPDAPLVDSSEQIYISSLALLKMLKHGRAGVPMEVTQQGGRFFFFFLF
jgi:hypothetical protein